MIKILFVCSVAAVTLAQEYDFMNNMVDFENPYQSISLPYPYQEDRQNRVFNIQSTPDTETFNLNNAYELVELPARLGQSMKQVKTSLSSIDKSFISILWKGASKFFGIAKACLSHLVLNVPAVALGAVGMVIFCKITSVCTKINSIKSLSEVQKEFSEFITPERLDMATEFIQDAIRKFRSIQAK